MKPYQRLVISWIKSYNVKRFAEIGVARCALAKEVLQNTDLEYYAAVDPWKVYSGRGAGTLARLKQEQWETWFQNALELGKEHSNLHIFRMESVQAAEQFKNGFFDMIFIDADHSYEAVRSDIFAWMPKIKKGGIISGHDYNKAYRTTVGKAVKEIFGEKTIAEYSCWFNKT